MEAAAELIVLIGKFSTGVERRQNHLDTGFLLFRMQIDGHTATIVSDRDGAIGVNHHIDLACKARQGLID